MKDNDGRRRIAIQLQRNQEQYREFEDVDIRRAELWKHESPGNG